MPRTLSVPMSLNSIFLIFTTYATRWKMLLLLCPEGEVKAVYSVTVWGLCPLTLVNTQDFMKGVSGRMR